MGANVFMPHFSLSLVSHQFRQISTKNHTRCHKGAERPVAALVPHGSPEHAPRATENSSAA